MCKSIMSRLKPSLRPADQYDRRRRRRRHGKSSQDFSSLKVVGVAVNQSGFAGPWAVVSDFIYAQSLNIRALKNLSIHLLSWLLAKNVGMNDGSFSSTFQVRSLGLRLSLPRHSLSLSFLLTAIQINVYFYRHQAGINFALLHRRMKDCMVWEEGGSKW